MRSRSILYAAVAVGCVLTPFCLGQQETAGQKEEDSRLAQKVTLTLQGESLSDLLKACRKQTGVPLSCSAACADQKVLLAVKDYPLGDLMSCLAEWLPGEWAAQGEGDKKQYRFNPDEEMLAKRRAWWKDVEKLMALADEIVQRYQRAHWEERVQWGQAAQRSSESSGPDETPMRRQAARMMAFLPDSYRNRVIRQTRIEQPGYYPPLAPSEWFRAASLPAEAQKALAGVIAANNEVIREREGREVPYPLPDPQAVSKAVVGFTNRNGMIDLHMRVPGSEVQIRADALFVDAPDDSLRIVTQYTDHRPLERLAKTGEEALEKQFGKEAARLIEKLAEANRQTFWPPAKPPSGLPEKNITIELREKGAMPRPIPLPGLLAQIAEKAEIPVIADYYTQRMTLTSTTSAIRDQPVEQVCAIFAKRFDYSWKAHRGALLWRNNRWYRDDAFQIPNRWLRRWVQAVGSVRQGFPSPDLDIYAEMAAALSPDQVRIGLRELRAERESDTIMWNRIGKHLQSQRSLLLFYASLPPAQKDALKTCGLPAQALNPQQRQALIGAASQEPFAPEPEAILNSVVRIERAAGEFAADAPFQLVFLPPSED
ncbi:MAG: hypothetical protein IT210_24690 [Armatimonadetes bacterium]|nr:hypothetical protein [Armatimonadota bacterium]